MAPAQYLPTDRTSHTRRVPLDILLIQLAVLDLCTQNHSEKQNVYASALPYGRRIAPVDLVQPKQIIDHHQLALQHLSPYTVGRHRGPVVS